MSPRADFDKIFDKKGKLLGVLNYNLMIPVEDKQLIKVNLKADKGDTIAEKHYKQLCIGESNYKGKDRCLDFVKLEKACSRYNNK